MAVLDIETYKLDFYILDINDPSSIILLDRSNYLFKPDKPRIFITPPGYTGDIEMEYPGVTNTVIEINSDILGITEACDYDQPLADLPDGVYEIRMAVCPYDELYCKKCYLRTTKLECQFNNILLQYDDCPCVDIGSFKKDVIDIDIALMSAKAEINQCNIDKAIKKYKLALKLVNSLQRKLNCD